MHRAENMKGVHNNSSTIGPYSEHIYSMVLKMEKNMFEMHQNLIISLKWNEICDRCKYAK